MSQPVDTVSVEIQYENTARSLASLRTGVDAALAQVTQEFDAAFDDIERGAQQAGQQLGSDIERGGERAESALREVSRQATQSMDVVQRESAQAGTALGGLSGIISKMGLATIGAGAAIGLGFLGYIGLTTAASLEQTEVAFSSLLGSVEEGTRVLDQLKEFATVTPFELTEITGAAQRFLAFNDSVKIADSQLRPFLTTLGDIASVTASGAEGLNRVTLALGQIASRGTVSLEDLQQIQEALPGFSAVAVIAAARGQTAAETLDQISAGAIDATSGIQDLLEGMQQFPGAAGAMAAQAKTLTGVLSGFKDVASQALADAFAPAIPAIKDVIAEITPLVGDALGVLAPQIGGVLVDVLAAIGPALKPLAGILAATIAALRPFLEIIMVVVQALLDGLLPVFVALEPVFVEMAVPVRDLVTALLPIIPPLAEILVAVVQLLAPLLKLVGLLASFLASEALVPIIDALAVALTFVALAVGQFATWLTRIDWDETGSAIGDFFSGIGRWITSVGRWFADLPGLIGDAIASMIMTLMTKAGELQSWLWTLPGRILGALVRLVIDAVTAIGNIDWSVVLLSILEFANDAGDAIIGFFLGALAWLRSLPLLAAEAFLALREVAIARLLELVGWFAGLPKRIMQALGNLRRTLWNAGLDLVRGLWEGVSSLAGWLWSKITDFIHDNIVQAAKSALGISSPSTVMRDEVGKMVPAGAAEGVEAGIPQLRGLVESMINPGDVGAGGGLGDGAPTIVMNFYGSLPTSDEARTLGQAAGEGLQRALQRRDTNAAVRMA